MLKRLFHRPCEMIKMDVADNMLDVHANIKTLPAYLQEKKHGYPVGR